MKSPAHRRHDISDRVWSLIEPHILGRKGDWGKAGRDNRLFINAVFWILRTGSPWRDLPPDYGDWKNTHRRFSRWRDKGVWARLQERLIHEPDFEWLMIDASHIKVHPDASGAQGGNQDMGITKGGLNSKIHVAVDSHGMPVKCFVTSGTTADCSQALALIDSVDAEYLLADRGYDTNALVSQAEFLGMKVVIPSRRNRKVLREHDKGLYRVRHLVENAFLHLKRWRGIATRYAKNTASFEAAVQIRCVALWAAIL
ncbi:IS5 family transposase [Dongshaea marina]|uniref:IS5 family transposase n=1 Tax=Dongshaea marina TaxID=2047966 RepID=UPI000D3E20C9|nr:IS5 family transposase [Dongshaea marina]